MFLARCQFASAIAEYQINEVGHFVQDQMNMRVKKKKMKKRRRRRRREREERA